MARLTIAGIAEAVNAGDDFDLCANTFAHDFRAADMEGKRALIADPPEFEGGEDHFGPLLAACAHMLANDNGLPVPGWVFEERFFMPPLKPYYSFGAKGELKSHLMILAPAEFRFRNLFVPPNIMTGA